MDKASPILKANRRGLSEVIATLLIILLSVALIAILAQFVIPFVRDSLNKSTECINHREYYKFQEIFSSKSGDLRYNCNSGNLTGFSINAGTDEESTEALNGFDVLLLRNGSSKRLDIRNAVPLGDNLRMLNMSIQNIRVPVSGGTETYVYEQEGQEEFVYAEVYPVLKSGRVCDIGDRIKLGSCSGAVSLKIK